jgi:perosamine synthetase
VESAITPRTRAIVAVDYAGQPSDLDEINAIAERYHLTVIEDGCHAMGATYRGRPVGALAHLTIFSLHPVKQITTGEGGLVTTNDADIAARLRLFRNHGISTDHRQREVAGSWFYEMVELGYNYRLTDFQCALGQSQLRKLPTWLARRREIATRYTEVFAAMPEVEPPTVLSDREPAWHLYVIRLNPDRLRAGRATVFKALRAEGIGVNVHYIPVPWHPYYQGLGYTKGQWPAAEEAYGRILSLPIWPGMTDRDVEDVIASVRKVIKVYRA